MKKRITKMLCLIWKKKNKVQEIKQIKTIADLKVYDDVIINNNGIEYDAWITMKTSHLLETVNDLFQINKFNIHRKYGDTELSQNGIILKIKHN